MLWFNLFFLLIICKKNIGCFSVSFSLIFCTKTTQYFFLFAWMYMNHIRIKHNNNTMIVSISLAGMNLLLNMCQIMCQAGRKCGISPLGNGLWILGKSLLKLYEIHEPYTPKDIIFHWRLVHHQYDVSKIGTCHYYHLSLKRKDCKISNKRFFSLAFAVIPNEIHKCEQCLRQYKSSGRMGKWDWAWNGCRQQWTTSHITYLGHLIHYF